MKYPVPNFQSYYMNWLIKRKKIALWNIRYIEVKKPSTFTYFLNIAFKVKYRISISIKLLSFQNISSSRIWSTIFFLWAEIYHYFRGILKFFLVVKAISVQFCSEFQNNPGICSPYIGKKMKIKLSNLIMWI